MKKTHAVSLLTDIRMSLPLCVSIAMIVMLGALCVIGISFASRSIKDTMDDYYRRVEHYDLQLLSGDGFDSSDIADIEGVSSVAVVEGGYIADAYLEVNSRKRVISVQTLTNNVNLAELVDGRMPDGDSECAIEESLLSQGIKIGDTLSLDFASSPAAVMLNSRGWKVTGVVRHPSSVMDVAERRGVSTLGNGCTENFIFADIAAFQGIFGNDAYGTLFVRLKETPYMYSDAASEYSAAARRDIEALNKGWRVLEKRETLPYAAMEIAADNLGRTGYAFSILFIGIAAMICYTSFGRMINERRALIGTQKALGIRTGELLLYYILFAALCALPGAVCGIIIGDMLIQPLLVSSYMTNLSIDKLSYFFGWGFSAAVVAAAVAVITASAAGAVVRLLKRPAIELMRREIKKIGRGAQRLAARIGGNGKSVKSSAMVWNLFSDTERLITTVIGIASCVALVIAGLSMRTGLGNITVRHYSDIFKSDRVLSVKNGADADKWLSLLSDNGIDDAFPFYTYACAFKYGQESNMASVIVTDGDGMGEYFALLNPYTGAKLSVPTDGVLLSVRTGEYNGISAGDMLTLSDADGSIYDVKVSGLIDNYIDHIIVMSNEYYSRAAGKTASPNQFYIRLNSADDGEATQALSRESDFLSYVSADYKRDQFESLATGINMIVITMLSLSAALAVVILYQLNKLTMEKKSSELAVMHSNGFSAGEIKSYISRENAIMTALGLPLGVALGVLMAKYMLSILQSDTVKVCSDISAAVCVISVVLVAAFSMLVERVLLMRWSPRSAFMKSSRQHVE